jgi:hypothetical protein
MPDSEILAFPVPKPVKLKQVVRQPPDLITFAYITGQSVFRVKLQLEGKALRCSEPGDKTFRRACVWYFEIFLRFAVFIEGSVLQEAGGRFSEPRRGFPLAVMWDF